MVHTLTQIAKPFPSLEPILSFVNVVKDYTNEGEMIRALDGVTLNIEPGTFVALVGRSGCGKSTLLHLAGALDFPTAGTVYIEGSEPAA